jgi:hypothetical protein
VGRLGDFHTIAFNRSFVAWERWGFDPTYYACFDPIVLEDNRHLIANLVTQSGVRQFFLHAAAQELGISCTHRVALVRLHEGRAFSCNSQEINDYGNVGASSLQILASLGYCKVVLIGVDARYDRGAAGPVDGGFIRVEDDADHFHPDYLRGMRRVAQPDLQKILGQWPSAALGARAAGLTIVNASLGSQLDCFERMDFEASLRWLSS